jgi:hypothetical protein
VREHARRQHRYLSREPDYGVVRAVDPMQVELQASGIVLDNEQMVVTQCVRQYDVQYGIQVGDAVKVTLMWNGDWLVEHVISDFDQLQSANAMLPAGPLASTPKEVGP